MNFIYNIYYCWVCIYFDSFYLLLLLLFNLNHFGLLLLYWLLCCDVTRFWLFFLKVIVIWLWKCDPMRPAARNQYSVRNFDVCTWTHPLFHGHISSHPFTLIYRSTLVLFSARALLLNCNELPVFTHCPLSRHWKKNQNHSMNEVKKLTCYRW